VDLLDDALGQGFAARFDRGQMIGGGPFKACQRMIPVLKEDARTDTSDSVKAC